MEIIFRQTNIRKTNIQNYTFVLTEAFLYNL